jgi:hypothetical protein
MKPIVALALLLLSSSTFAASIVAESVTIKSLTTYSEQGIYDGDIAILLESPPAGCPGGYWLRHADTPGYKNTVAFLVSAFHARTPVRIVGYNDPGNIWSGSSPAVCRTDQISLISS